MPVDRAPSAAHSSPATYSRDQSHDVETKVSGADTPSFPDRFARLGGPAELPPAPEAPAEEKARVGGLLYPERQRLLSSKHMRG